MSHYLTIVESSNSEICEKLERYSEWTEEPEFLEFSDETEEYKKEYEGTTLAVKYANGDIIEPPNSKFNRKYIIKDGKVYEKEWGKNRIEKRSKKAKRIKVLRNYPLKKVYKTFDEFATKGRHLSCNDEGEYGHYYNPEAQLDWFVAGGRFAESILIKESVTDFVEDESIFKEMQAKKYAPKGYKWVCGAKKCDIEWDLMKRIEIKQAVKSYYTNKAVFESGKIQNSLTTIEEEKLIYLGEILYIKGESLKDYCIRNGLYNSKYCVECDAYVNSDDECYSIYNDVSIESNAWGKKVEQFIKTVDDDHYIIFVDCHI